MCGFRGIAISLRVRFQKLLRGFDHVSLSSVSQFCGRSFQGDPQSALYLHAHFFTNLADYAGLIAK
jgi:hypothetical protein